MRLSNKVAIVTGSSSGIGRAIALQYALHGAKLVCADLTPLSRSTNPNEQTTPTHEAIITSGGKAVFHQTDVGDAAQMQRLVQRAVTEYGRLDIMVNNAGMGTGQWSYSELHLADEDLWDTTMRVNAKSVFLGCKYALAQMLEQEPHPSGDRGWIVNMSSIASLVALINIAPYAASKGAVSSMTRQAAVDYAPHRIHINAICPGFAQTPLITGLVLDSTLLAELNRQHPFGGVGDPEDVARVAVMLASDDARWMTGVCLPVDGGYTAK